MTLMIVIDASMDINMLLFAVHNLLVTNFAFNQLLVRYLELFFHYSLHFSLCIVICQDQHICHGYSII